MTTLLQPSKQAELVEIPVSLATVDQTDDAPLTREEWESVPRYIRDGLADFFLRLIETEMEDAA